MKLTGERLISLPQERVWQGLIDPEVLRQCIPGCESFEKISDNGYKAMVATRIGPLQARFSGTVLLSDLDPPNGYTITGEGTGGAAGGAKGVARVTLSPNEAGGTRLSWTAEAQVTGKLAQIGSRLIDSTANMMAGQFFDRFQEAVTGAPLPAKEKAGTPIWLWIALAIIVAAIIAAFFGFGLNR